MLKLQHCFTEIGLLPYVRASPHDWLVLILCTAGIMCFNYPVKGTG